MPTLIIHEDVPRATTEGNIHFESSFSVEQNNPWDSSCTIPLEIKIPDSFWEGLEDCDAGRVVDTERALNEPPPE